MSHRWESLLFLHWAISPGKIQQTLPPGLTVDTFEGNAYLGIIPFFMKHVRFRWLPPLPGLSSFQELNVRTYVYDHRGIPGVWFYSLSCNQPMAVTGARLSTGLAYVNAEMWSEKGELIDYRCRRRRSSAVAQYRYRGEGMAREAEANSLEFFLLERYYFYAVRFGSLLRAQVAHNPYRYTPATVAVWSPIPVQLDGFVEICEPPSHACHVTGLDVKICGTQKLGLVPSR